MDRMMLTAEILKIAKSLTAMNFPTQEALDKYMKEHPDADRSNHKVVEKKEEPAKKEAPEKKSKPLSRDEEDQVADAVRGHLHGTKRVVTKETMHALLGQGKKGLTQEQFGKVWDSMVEDEYLKPTSGGYRWNDEGEFTSSVKEADDMDRMTLASEILRIAKSMTAMNFPTQEALDKYLKEHPDSDRANHRVIETKKEAPAKKEPASKKTQWVGDDALVPHYLTQMNDSEKKEFVKSMVENEGKDGSEKILKKWLDKADDPKHKKHLEDALKVLKG